MLYTARLVMQSDSLLVLLSTSSFPYADVDGIEIRAASTEDPDEARQEHLDGSAFRGFI